ncbi:MAG: hypothetical protein G01um101416_279 [Microgenomates group bacterium Gr01-1014_16]|nr:MAG: hypothetical protein G01um101416_279 [Microgenomates group bacterium Gr01-1014_16]
MEGKALGDSGANDQAIICWSVGNLTVVFVDDGGNNFDIDISQFGENVALGGSGGFVKFDFRRRFMGTV